MLLKREVPGGLGSSIAQSILEEVQSLFVLDLMPLIKIEEDVSIPLYEHLRVLLSVKKLLISITLDSLEEILHEALLLLFYQILLSLILLKLFLLFSHPFKAFQLISKILEVRGSIIVLGRECLLLHVSVVVKLFRFCELLW